MGNCCKKSSKQPNSGGNSRRGSGGKDKRTTYGGDHVATGEELRKIFDEFDVNKDGQIDRMELHSVMIKMGQSPTDDELEAMFKAADSNDDGIIEFEEFLKIAQANPIGLSLRSVFDEIDSDGNGSISRAELRVAFQKMGHELDDEQVNGIYRQVDLNTDGRISFEEFVLMMTKL